MVDSSIDNFLSLYKKRLDTVTMLFSDKFGVKNPLSKWRQGLINRTGFLDNARNIEYSFHGAGCTVLFENREIVSFDFLENDCPTFDTFKLKVFVSSISNNTDYIEKLFSGIKLVYSNEDWIIECLDGG